MTTTTTTRADELTAVAVRTKRLWDPTVVGILFVTLYTCPAGETTILKHLSLYNTAVLGNALALAIAPATPSRQIGRWPLVVGEALQVVGQFIVLQPGDELMAIASAASITCTGFGSQLEGVAD